jgi:D-alanyl-D-alanine carboxypeptidase (penicillin-binding protein 5/6)
MKKASYQIGLVLIKNISLIIFAAIFYSKLVLADDFANSYPELSKVDYLFLIDQDTKEVLLEKNADERIAPSSMTKLMTAYVIFNQLEKGQLSLSNQCVIGKDAWRKKGSTMFLDYGDMVSIDRLIAGLLIASGNDAAVALAQASSGSVDGFAALMNQTAQEIGLENSNFRNPHGLNQDRHYMSLRDLATLASRLSSDFPEYLHYFVDKKFSYQNITQYNRNPLIKKNYVGATGMKTGHTSDGGYGIVGTAQRGDRRLIAVVNKTKTSAQRARTIVELLDFGFNGYKKVKLLKQSDVFQAKTWLGQKDQLLVSAKEDVMMTLSKNQQKGKMQLFLQYDGPLHAPIFKGDQVGSIIVNVSNKKVKEIPLFAKENIDKASYFKRIYSVLEYKFLYFIKNNFK